MKFGDRRVNDLELLYGCGVACLQRPFCGSFVGVFGFCLLVVFVFWFLLLWFVFFGFVFVGFCFPLWNDITRLGTTNLRSLPQHRLHLQ